MTQDKSPTQDTQPQTAADAKPKKPAAKRSVKPAETKSAPAKKNPAVKTSATKPTTTKSAAAKPAASKAADKTKLATAAGSVPPTPDKTNQSTKDSAKPAAKPKAAARKPANPDVQAINQDSVVSAPPSSPADKPKPQRSIPDQPPTPRRPVKRSAGERARLYWQLMRMHKPIGALLLLWPTLWSLWLAADGVPRWDVLVIFVLGVFVMRSAGCVINDFADRKVDGHVKRTRDRPLASGAVSSGEAIGLFLVLCLVAFGLVLLTNTLTIQLSVGGVLLAFCYPFMKRYTHLPQVVLGAAFAWAIPMAFAAQSGALGVEVWLLYTAVVLWTVVYDTFYAMVDRDDDLRIGVKSTAVLFGDQDRFMTGLLQALTLYALVMVGSRFELGSYYYASLGVTAALFIYQQYLIRFRERDACFKAFMNNNWVGLVIFIGILLDSSLS